MTEYIIQTNLFLTKDGLCEVAWYDLGQDDGYLDALVYDTEEQARKSFTETPFFVSRRTPYGVGKQTVTYRNLRIVKRVSTEEIICPPMK